MLFIFKNKNENSKTKIYEMQNTVLHTKYVDACQPPVTCLKGTKHKRKIILSVRVFVKKPIRSIKNILRKEEIKISIPYR